MNVSGFFVNKPIFASVLSLLIFIAGAIAMFQLPIAEYPNVAPPTVNVTARFPGANPAEVSETVATPLEEQINGVENMIYMTSLATSDGSLSLRATFAIGTDPDLAQQLVQNRVAQALPRLPEVTRQLGVVVQKSTPDLTMVVHLRSPEGTFDGLYLRNYATLNIRDELAKIPGVGEARIFGSGDYAMRIWLNPNKIAERGLTANEVVDAVRRQNQQVAGGVIGGPPYGNEVQVQMPVNVEGRLKSVEDFENVIIRRDARGVVTRLRDVARVALESQSYSLRSLLNNQQAVALPIFASPGANALDISDAVRATMKRLGPQMPEGVEYTIVYDPTVFVRSSINAVITTLLEAIALVVLVVVIFLQTWRASIVPLLAVPVSIVGTFAFMHLFGFSINVLSLFGLILAVGIVVDDAIVVVENVERNVEHGIDPKAATIKAMKEVTGPIIATSLVIAAVFVPIAFVSGLTGQFYKQFALTIAIATFISTINSLTLSPALSAILIKPKSSKKDLLTKAIDFLFGWFFRWFNKVFDRGQDRYAGSVKMFTTRKFLMMGIFGLLTLFAGYSFKLVPNGFVPAQDKGYLISFAQLPPGATLERTESVLREMAETAKATEGVGNAVQFPGLSINGFINTPSAGIVFVVLDEFKDRTKPELNGFAIAKQLQGKFNQIDDAFIAIFPPPPVRGLANVGGFKLQLQDRANMGYEELFRAVQLVQQKASERPELARVFSNFNVNYPQIFADVDRTRAEQLGVPVDEIFRTMQIYLGSRYVNDFNQFGRTYQVIAQTDSEFRSKPEDIAQLQTRNAEGRMVPLGSLLDIQETFGPETATNYNAFRAADINGQPAPGYSSGQAQDAIVEVLDEVLPQGISYEWTELTLQEKLAGNTAIFIFPLCLFLVFLVLAAQYESLVLPIAVILIVPMAVLSAILGIYFTGGDNNVFTQIALFLLAGLASKNAILIVEFARELEREGRTIVQAAIESSRLRLRPILMTSIAFIMGVLPLATSSGAGSEMRQAIGIAVFYGMIGVTIFGLIFTPVFYVFFRKLAEKFSSKPNQETEQSQASSEIAAK